jgi:hypothetical protein
MDVRHWTLSILAIYSLNGCSLMNVVKSSFATSVNKCECLSELPGIVRMPNKTNLSLIKFGIMSAINSTGKRSRADCVDRTALGPICSFGPLVAGIGFFIENIVQQFHRHTASPGRNVFLTETREKSLPHRPQLLYIAPTLTASFTSEYDNSQT